MTRFRHYRGNRFERAMSLARGSSRRGKSEENALRWWPPALAVAIVVPVDQTFSTVTGQSLSIFAFAADVLFAFFILSSVCELSGRSRARWAGSVLVLGLLAGSAVFFAVFGRTPRPRDIVLLPDLLRMIHGQAPYFAAAAALAAVVPMVGPVRRRPRSALRVAACWLILGVPLLAFSARPPGGVQSFVQGQSEIGWLGHFGTFYLEAGRAFERHALEGIAPRRPAGGSFLDRQIADPELRSIHVIVVESLFDTSELTGFSLSADPYPPMVRAARPARVFSPVLGNRSSNPEFELLCGLPAVVPETDLVFSRLVAAEVDCLPRKLRRHGWATVASVSSDGSIFNARNAYAALGFEHVRFAEDFVFDDTDGGILAAESQLRQNREVFARLAKSGKVLDYTFINSGHIPYLLDEARRPRKILVSPANEELERYVNLTRYTLEAIERHVAEIQRIDASALVIVIGDHRPPLGTAYGTYAAGYGLGDDRSALFERHALDMTAVPLMVFGVGGGNAWPELSQYQVPGLLAGLVSGEGDCGGPDCRAEVIARPLATEVLVRRPGATVVRCPYYGFDPQVCGEHVGAASYFFSLLKPLIS